MSVAKDGDGRRSVQVETEVPGTPEQVWRAIATAEGISSWFVPATTELDAKGKPVRMTLDFGPGMASVSDITSWQPPVTFAADSKDLGEAAPSIATQWFVEAKEGGICVVRVVHSLFASTDEWDDQLEGWESGWPDFFRLLKLYLEHFEGQPSVLMQCAASSSAAREAVWTTMTSALGLEQPTPGQRGASAASAPALGGVVEHVGSPAHPQELVLRLDQPTSGIAHLFALDMGEGVFLSVRLYLYGAQAEATRRREQPIWEAWLAEHIGAPPAAEAPSTEGGST